MATFKRFEDIEAWQKARILCNAINEISKQKCFYQDIKLRDQVKSSSGSTMDNIAEGFERGGKAEFIYFLSIAKGSVGETRSQLYRIFDFNYIDAETFNKLFDICIETSKKITALMEYLKKTDIKGTKYKPLTNLKP